MSVLSNDQVFPSKVDLWVTVSCWLSAAVSLFATVTLLGHPSFGMGVLAAAVLLLGGVLPLWLITSTRYAFGEAALTARSGPFRWTIPYPEIREVVPSQSLLSGPALSMDRLEIRYSSGKVLLVSPEDREGFLAAVAARTSPA